MIKAYAVVGSGWGDEGKGNVTDILCSRNPSNTINVRINGMHLATLVQVLLQVLQLI